MLMSFFQSFSREGYIIHIVSYNIHGAQCDVNEIIKVLAGINADIVSLQEVDCSKMDQAKAIGDALRMTVVFSQAHQTRNYGNAILSKFPVHHIEKLKLPHGSLTKEDGSRMPGANEDRLALIARISPFHDSPQHDFIFIATHFGIYTQNDANQEEPVNIIADFLNQNENTCVPAVLAGDLNAQPLSAVITKLKKEWNCYDSVPTFRDIKIDYILDKGRGIYKMEEGAQLVIETNASDHRPLIAKWRVISPEIKESLL